jgi:hypothetical protein
MFSSSSSSKTKTVLSDWLDKLVSGFLYLASSLVFKFRRSSYGNVRALGISNLPTAVRLLFAGGRKDEKKTTTKNGSDDKKYSNSAAAVPVEDVTDIRSLLYPIWSTLQILSVPSAFLNIHPTNIMKASAIFNIVLVVEESISQRYQTQKEYERQLQEKQEKELQRRQYWKAQLPRCFYKLIFERRTKGENVTATSSVTTATAKTTTTTTTTVPPMKQSSTVSSTVSSSEISSLSTTTTSSSNTTTPIIIITTKDVVLEKTKKIVQGQQHRQSNIDDVLWGLIQCIMIFHDVNMYYHTLLVSWVLLLIRILEDVVMNPRLTKKQKYTKAFWILLVAVGSGKLLA